MSPTRRLNGIAALSAGALASVGLSTPVTAADVPGDEPGIPPTGEGIPEDLLIEWESERGVDLPADLFIKLEDPIAEFPSGGAFIKWQYRPGSETSEPLLIKWDYPAGGSATGDAFHKVEYGLGDAEGQVAIRELGDAFAKVEGTDAFAKIEGTAGDSRSEDLFIKYDGLDGEALAADPFVKWDFESADEPAADAFIKLEIAADDTAAGVTFLKWEYDALDLIEDSLVELGDATSLEGDPDRPIITALEQVRDLRGSGARINPFVDRDKAMKALPLPKKLPADAGTYTTPRAGTWRSVNLPGTVRCGGQTQRIARTVSDNVSLQLKDGGTRIVGRDLGERGSKVALRADPDVSGRYLGTVELKAPGGRVEMDLTMQLITDEHVVGSAAITVKAAGQRCKITRGFEMTFKGE